MNFLKKSKLKILALLTAIAVLAFGAFVFTACTPPAEESSEAEKTYDYVENDEQELANGNFEFGTADVKASDFPYSASGWSQSTDNSAKTVSLTTSGIIDTEETAFAKTLKTLLGESLSNKTSFRKTMEKALNLNDDQLREEAKEALGEDATEEEIVKWINEKVLGLVSDYFVNPGTPADGANGTKIYMLNNYIDYYVNGTAQKITSSSAFTLKAGEYAKFTVYLRTFGVTPIADTDSFGANIRITTSVNSVQQDSYSVSNIVSEDGWACYEIYVKANDFADTSVSIVLGLGYGNGSSTKFNDAVRGTVFFDDISYEKVEEADLPAIDPDYITIKNEYSEEKQETANLANNVAYVSYETKNYFEDATFVRAYLAKTPAPISEIPADATEEMEMDGNNITVTQKNNSTTLTIYSESFTVLPARYVMVSFDLTLDIDDFEKTGVSLFLYDTFEGHDNHQQVFVNHLTKDKTNFKIIVKNNFAEGSGEREFYLMFIFGPIDASTDDATSYSTGSFSVENITFHNGLIKDDNDNDAAIYSMISGLDDTNTFAIFAGYDADYPEDDDTTSYVFKPSYSDIGTITHSPANPLNYTGAADYGKTYLDNDNEFAGVINSDYIDEYEDNFPELAAAIGDYEDAIQPLMIYNPDNGNYGFIGTNNTISASTTYTVKVKVRVYGEAVAYIYLIDVKTESALKPLEITFTADGETEEQTHLLYTKVTSDMMGDDGWVEIYFYIAAGKDNLTYRLELWNGERFTEGENVISSKGYVFFDEVSLGSTFDEGTIISDALSSATIEPDDRVFFTRAQEGDTTYTPGVVWVNANGESNKGSFVFAVYNTINPAPDEEDSEEDTPSEATGCAKVDGGQIFLSVATIALIVALAAAIVALIVREVSRKRKANENDAKSHYTVSSRNKSGANRKAVKTKKATEQVKPVTEEDEALNKALDETSENSEYVYGEVLEDFDDKENKEAEEQGEDETERVVELDNYGDVENEIVSPENTEEDNSEKEDK